MCLPLGAGWTKQPEVAVVPPNVIKPKIDLHVGTETSAGSKGTIPRSNEK